MSRPEARALLRAAFDAAVGAAQAEHCLPPFLPGPPGGRSIVVGAGKAAAAMALAVTRRWSGDLSGLVVTPHGHGLACPGIEVLEASHPLPGEAGRLAAVRLLECVTGLGRDDLVICLLSGGGSALLPLPVEGLTLEEKGALTARLLRCGAAIHEINCVRRHLSQIKGGRLAAACHPARVLTLAISDVPGDDPVDIASGPTVGDPTTCAQALAVLDRYRIAVPEPIRTGLSGGAFETIKPGDPRLARSTHQIVASSRTSLDAAVQAVTARGVDALVVSDCVQGEACDVGREFARTVRLAADELAAGARPRMLLAGGETTVTLRGNGRGGRNVEFLLAFGLALGDHPQVHALAADTDGVDGTEAIAGAFWVPDTLARAAAQHLDAAGFLRRNDAHSFFSALGDSLVTGPTRTNVNDLHAILILPPDAGVASRMIRGTAIGQNPPFPKESTA